MTDTHTPPLAGAPDLQAFETWMDMPCKQGKGMQDAFIAGMAHQASKPTQSVSVPEQPIGCVEIYNQGGSGEFKVIAPIGKPGYSLAESLPAGTLMYAGPLPQPQADAVVKDLAMLVRRLARALAKADPSNALPHQAVDYLQRKGLQGSPLRAEPDLQDDHDSESERPEFEKWWESSAHTKADNCYIARRYAAIEAWQARARLARTAAPSEPDQPELPHPAMVKGAFDYYSAGQMHQHGKSMRKQALYEADLIHKGLIATMAESFALQLSQTAPAPLEAQPIPTDLSARIRRCIAANGAIDRVTSLAAADEIDRYYGGMLAWKAAAEEKDKRATFEEWAKEKGLDLALNFGTDVYFQPRVQAMAEGYRAALAKKGGA